MKSEPAAKSGIWIGGVWSLAMFLWNAVGTAQQAQQIYTDRALWQRIISSPWSGALLAIASLVALFVVRHHDDATPLAIRTPDALEPGVNDRPSLKGKFFHTFNDEGRYQFQGQVLREEPDGRLFVQFYDAWFGQPSNRGLLTAAQAATARFYDDDEEWRSEGQRLIRRDSSN